MGQVFYEHFSFTCQYITTTTEVKNKFCSKLHLQDKYSSNIQISALPQKEAYIFCKKL